MDRVELRWQDYCLTPEQSALQDSFRAYFTDMSPPEVVRAAGATGYDAALWRGLVKLGVASMGVPEPAGGDGAGLVELALVAETAGFAAAPVPLVSHVVATRVLAATAPDGAAFAAALAGEPACLALRPAQGGARQLVPGSAVATRVVALVDDTLVATSAGLPAPLTPNQGSTPLGWWTPEPGEPGAPGERVATGSAATTAHTRAVAEWKILQAAQLVGLTQAALDDAVACVSTRQTLGVPIGSLQGVSFPLADVAIGVASARNLVRRAAWTLDHEPDLRPDLPSVAWHHAVDVATRGTTTAAHVQGGLGYLTDSAASLYVLRAKGWGVLAGDPQRDLVAIGAALAARTTTGGTGELTERTTR
ncbi:acyl-CoA dehydrogenase [Streptosporangium sp. NPDC051022]|uniref:acyl-CoA dehydrogenase n=1 Tax=Streptosporangium sp. NPDC051022 TaxID=3155752 RepID=UPI00343B0903